MTVSHLSQLRRMQEENAKLKRMYADLALMRHSINDVVDRELWAWSDARRLFNPSWPSAA